MAVVEVALVVAAYFVGTFPTAILVGRRRGLDPTQAGSGNPGATNIHRLAGKKAGAVVLAIDLAKGALPAAVGLAVGGRPLGYACWVAAVLGHVFPVTRRFRGGKGVATGGGGIIVLLPLIAVICLVVFVVVLKITHRGFLGSLAMAVLTPVLTAVFGYPWWEVVTIAAMTILVVARHRSNLSGLMRAD